MDINPMILSQGQPNLLGDKMQSTIYKITKIKSNNSTISDQISNSMSNFYETYIQENKVIALIIIAIIAFFVYRYYDKQQKEEENFSSQDYNMLKDVIPMQTAHLRYDTQPTLNPLYSVDSQKEKVYYPPDPLPVNIPNLGMMYTRNLYGEPNSFTPMINTDNHDYNNVYKNNSRSYYTGTYNPYEGAQDSNIPNALGYPVDFNSTTGDFVGGMVDSNRKNIVDYQTILEGMNQNIANNLGVGPKYLGCNTKSKMEPPYAPDF